MRLVLGVWKELETTAAGWGEQTVAGMTVVRTRLELRNKLRHSLPLVPPSGRT